MSCRPSGVAGIVAGASLALSLLASSVGASPWDNRPKLLLHLGSVTQKNVCASGELSDCRSAVTAGQLASGPGGPFYYAYLLVAPGDVGNIAGVELGIQYQSGCWSDADDGRGIDVFSWTNCATMQFDTAGLNRWPRPGGGTIITWDYINRCQTGGTGVAGYFYVGCYSVADTMQITPRPATGEANVASCVPIDIRLYSEDLGSVAFSPSGMTDGCNPCSGPCLPPRVYTACAASIDTLPPGPIHLTLGSTYTTRLGVTWLAPADDPDHYGTVAVYDLRYSTSPLDESNFANATVVANVPAPASPGTHQGCNVSPLAPGTTYYFAIRSADHVPNWSGLSNVLVASTNPLPVVEATPPAAVVDLSVVATTDLSATLSWTAPGDDSLSGTAAQYDLRWSEAPITAADFGTASQVAGEPAPAAAGTAQLCTVTGLTPSRLYYFAMKTADEVPNWSGLSNLTSGSTLPPAPPDTIPPAAIVDLAVTDARSGIATLNWTAPGDDSLSGTAAGYDLRCALQPITAENFAGATRVTAPAPLAAGSRQGALVGPLSDGQNWYFAIRTRDEASNWAPLSNVPSRRMPFHWLNNTAKIMLHLASPTSKNACSSAPITDCSQIVTAGDLASPIGGGPFYYAYLLAGEFGELAGLECGITYDQNRLEGINDGAGLDIFSWTICATLAFPSSAPRDWPRPGSGNLITWDAVSRCQSGFTAVAGYFYVGAYGPDELRIIPRPVSGIASVSDCGAIEAIVDLDFLGSVRFSQGATVAGVNPCGRYQSVPVLRVTWSRIKTLFGP